MIKCPYCEHEMLEGALFCEECGLSLWGDLGEEASTRKLEEESEKILFDINFLLS